MGGTSTFSTGRRNGSDPFDLGIDRQLIMAFDLVTVCMTNFMFFTH
jgi:hypothetical protein